MTDRVYRRARGEVHGCGGKIKSARRATVYVRAMDDVRQREELFIRAPRTFLFFRKLGVPVL